MRRYTLALVLIVLGLIAPHSSVQAVGDSAIQSLLIQVAADECSANTPPLYDLEGPEYSLTCPAQASGSIRLVLHQYATAAEAAVMFEQERAGAELKYYGYKPTLALAFDRHVETAPRQDLRTLLLDRWLVVVQLDAAADASDLELVAGATAEAIADWSLPDYPSMPAEQILRMLAADQCASMPNFSFETINRRFDCAVSATQSWTIGLSEYLTADAALADFASWNNSSEPLSEFHGWPAFILERSFGTLWSGVIYVHMGRRILAVTVEDQVAPPDVLAVAELVYAVLEDGGLIAKPLLPSAQVLAAFVAAHCDHSRVEPFWSMQQANVMCAYTFHDARTVSLREYPTRALAQAVFDWHRGTKPLDSFHSYPHYQQTIVSTTPHGTSGSSYSGWLMDRWVITVGAHDADHSWPGPIEAYQETVFNAVKQYVMPNARQLVLTRFAAACDLSQGEDYTLTATQTSDTLTCVLPNGDTLTATLQRYVLPGQAQAAFAELAQGAPVVDFHGYPALFRPTPHAAATPSLNQAEQFTWQAGRWLLQIQTATASSNTVAQAEPLAEELQALVEYHRLMAAPQFVPLLTR